MAHRRPNAPDYRALYGLRDGPIRYPDLANARFYARGSERPARIFDGKDGTFWVVWAGDAPKLEGAGFAPL